MAYSPRHQSVEDAQPLNSATSQTEYLKAQLRPEGVDPPDQPEPS
jgi:hypothetical protein